MNERGREREEMNGIEEEREGGRMERKKEGKSIQGVGKEDGSGNRRW